MPSYLFHVYIAYQIKRNSAYLAGNAFPDLGVLIYLKEGKVSIRHKNIIKFASYLERIKFNSWFIKGIHDHILLDVYTHGKYIVPKSRQLAKKYGFDDKIIHVFLEMALTKKVIEKNPEIIFIAQKALYRHVELALSPILKKFFTKVDIEKILQDAKELALIKKYDLYHLVKIYKVLKKYYSLRVLKISSLIKIKDLIEEINSWADKICSSLVKDCLDFIRRTRERKFTPQ